LLAPAYTSKLGLVSQLREAVIFFALVVLVTGVALDVVLQLTPLD